MDMPRLTVFNSMSVDGAFCDANGDMSFAHNGSQDPEWDALVASNARGGGTLLFGRITYELMASFWPTRRAAEQMPVVAERMNNLPKVVFSRTLDKASWGNTRLVKSDMLGEIRKMKKAPGPDMTILGSGSIVSQLSDHGLIDEYQLVVIPVALGSGRTMFEGVAGKVRLRLMRTRVFANGNVLLCYERSPSADR
jgi:dihydrofolate reductase